MSNPFGPEPTEGGGLTNFTGTIIDGFFVDGEYGCSLNWVIEFDHPELYPNAQNPTKLFVAAGTGWSATDAGEGVEHKDAPGEEKAFNKKSEMGVLNMRLRSGELDNYEAFMADLPATFSFYKASSWKGLRFRFDEVTWDTQKMDDDGKWVPSTKTRRFPVEYLGKQGGAAPAASETLDVTALGLPDSLRVAITDAAVASTSAPDFGAKLISVEGAVSNTTLIALMSDSAKVAALRDALRANVGA